MGLAALKLKKLASRHLASLTNAWRDSGPIAREHDISRIGLLASAATHALRGRMAPDTYFYYRLFDPAVKDRDSYISDAPRANARMWATLTPPKFRSLYDNKFVFNRFFSAAGLPVAKIHAVYDRTSGFGPFGPLRTAQDLARVIDTLPQGFVFKPVEGMRAHLTLVFGPSVNGELRTLSGERWTAEKIAAAALDTAALRIQNKGISATGFLLQDRIRPHSALEELLGPTLCTTRIVTVIREDGTPSINSAVFKLQEGNVGIDLMRLGAIAAWVNEDGTLGRGRTRTTCDWLTKLPSGKPFVGFKLPHWDSVRECALKAAAAFPWARAIGWDLGITESGPMLLEGNERWSPSLSQLPAPYGLMSGDLKRVYEGLMRVT